MSLSLDNFLAGLSGQQLNAANREIGKYLNTRLKHRLAAQQTADGAAFAPRRGKGGKMLKGFANLTFTRIDPESVAVGYNGRAAKLARTHNLGLLDRIKSQSGALVMANYPARQWAGINADDEAAIMQILQKKMESGNA
ncbi:phage virion morphogenesis protein [Thiothrix sp.]|jgi:phage virion morphogenesis protein|uniref:phage virion morphogenesis protein n=1 Tax=Thiothrix sp. TaxID=1032 RepID=UPI00257CFE44|nr:phage virion morphogenesis protein [Thiothrix sp.]